MGNAMLLKHVPGSPEAIALGCTCPPALNHSGRHRDSGAHLFHYCDPACSVHAPHMAEHGLAAEGEIVLVQPLHEFAD